MPMTAAERRAALADVNAYVGQRAREITDKIHEAMAEEVIQGELPTNLRRALSVNQVVAQELAPSS